MRVATGDASRYAYFAAVDVTDLKTPETGLTGFTVAHSVAGGADVPWTTPTTAEIDNTAAPGLYALLLDELPTITSGVDEQEVALIISHASMRTVFRTVELYRPKLTAGQTLTVTSGLASANTTQIEGTDATDALDAAFLRNVTVEPSANGTAQGGTSLTLQMEDGEYSAITGSYIGDVVELTGGTAGDPPQVRVITGYDEATGTITVGETFRNGVAPSSDTTYIFWPDHATYAASKAALQTVDDEVAAIQSDVTDTLTAVAAVKSDTAAILVDTGTDGVRVADGSIADDTLATDLDVYQARVWLFKDDANTTDRYVVAWYKNGAPVVSGITTPLIQVYAVANGADLVASTAMTQIASTGTYRYAEATNRTTAGAGYMAKVTATIDGSARVHYQPVGRDSAAA